MSRSITDPIEEPEQDQEQSGSGTNPTEIEEAMTRLINGYNKLYDRIVNIERRIDELSGPDYIEDKFAKTKTKPKRFRGN